MLGAIDESIGLVCVAKLMVRSEDTIGFVPLLMSWKQMKKVSSKQRHQKKKSATPGNVTNHQWVIAFQDGLLNSIMQS